MHDRIPGLRRLFRLPATTARRARADVDDEIAFHLAERARDLEADGLSPEAAGARAREEFGDVERARRSLAAGQVRRARGRRVTGALADAVADARLALRGLARAPALTVVVVLTLALGIGANATLLGMVDRLLLRPPAGVVEPARVVRVYGRNGWTALTRSWPDYVDLRDGARTLAAVAAYRTGDGVARLPARTRVRVQRATASYLPLLGVRPVRGRLFARDEDAASPAPVALVGERLWRGALAGDPAVVGRRIVLDGTPHAIVGVLPAAFTGVDDRPVDIWVPLGALRPDRGNYGAVNVIARLADGVTTEVADVDANRANRAGLAADGLAPDEDKMTLGALSLTRGPAAPREVRVATWLAGVGLLVLLASVANVAHLLLARGLARRQDAAIRAALGAGRGRLARQGMVEGVLLGALGGLASLLVAAWSTPLLGRFLLGQPMGDDASLGADARLLVVAGGLALLVGVCCGLVVAVQALRGDHGAALRGASRAGASVTLGSGRVRAALLATQVACTMVLLVGAALFARSLREVRALPLGFDAERMVVVRLDESERSLGDSARVRLLARMAAEARRAPGVTGVSAAHALPFTSSWRTRFHVPGRDPARWGKEGGGRYNFLSTFTDAGYLRVAGLPLLAGRWLEAADSGDVAVAVVNEPLARTVWPDAAPSSVVGRCIHVVAPDAPCTRIVGVVGGTRVESVFDEAPEQYYLSLAQPRRDETPAFVVARVDGDAARRGEALRRALQAGVPSGVDVAVAPLAEAIDPVRRPWELGAVVFSMLAGLVLLVAATGLYGLGALLVAERTRELGVRRALGAAHGDVVRVVARRVVAVLAVGSVAGLGAGAMAARAGAAQLYGVHPLDPLSYAVAAVTLVVVAALACVGPVRRALRVTPLVALRDG